MTVNIMPITSNRETKAWEFRLPIPMQNSKDTYMAAEKLNISWRSANTVLKQQMSLSVKTVPASMWNLKGSQGSKAVEASPVHLAVTQHKLLSLPHLQGNSRLISPQTAFKVKYNKIQCSTQCFPEEVYRRHVVHPLVLHQQLILHQWHTQASWCHS